MKIRSLKASFGRLNGDELRLGDGLNIITAPNEAGKSTWSALIRAMLYGIDTSERDKIGYIADKTRYRPWSGAPMEGVMEAEAWGRPVRITRESPSASMPMKKFSAVFTDTGEEVPNISAESAGLRLTGVEQPVFRRSCFVEQGRLGVDKAAELEKRIQALVSTGDEAISYSEADERLRAWRRRIRHNNSGELPKLEQRIAELRSQQSRQQELNRAAGELRARALRLEQTREDLSAQLLLHEKLENAETIQRRWAASRERDQAADAKTAADQALGRYAQPPFRGTLQDALKKLDELGPARQSLTEAEQRLEKARADVEQTRNDRDTTPHFGGQSADEAWQTARTLKERETGLLTRAKPRVPLLCVVWVVLIAVSAAGWFLLKPPIPYAVTGGCVLAALAVTLLLLRRSGKARRAHAALLAQYGVTGGDELLQAASLYRDKCSHCEAAEAAVRTAAEELDRFRSELESRTRAALAPARTLDDTVTDELSARTAIQTALELLDTQSAAGERLIQAQKLCAAVGEYRGEPLVDPAQLERPSMDKQNVITELAEARAQLERCGREAAAREGALSETGDPAAIAAELAELTTRAADLEQKMQALDGAIEVLKTADTDLRTRFSPLLNQRSGEILAQLTGGRYATVMFNDKFEAEALSDQDVVARRGGMLSAGTLDQIYLALRLAISELVLPEGANPPLILDDALANFDDARMASALDWLAEASDRRQILLFTCHGRESDYLRDRKNVNTITL